MTDRQQQLRDEMTFLLQDTVDEYTVRGKRRSKSAVTNKCSYSPLAVGIPREESNGCAIGKHMTAEQQDKADGSGPAAVALLPRTLIPESLRKFGMDFLRQLQILHDSDSFWEPDKPELSLWGLTHVATLKKAIARGIYDNTRS